MKQEILNILITIGLSMLPILEVRASIPFATLVLEMPTWQAFLWSVLGNILIVAILLRFLEPVTRFLIQRSSFFENFLNKLFHKTRHRHTARFNELGALFLVTFVAIPLPMTGAWTGTLIAFLFGVRFWPALSLISAGIVGAAALVSLGFESISAIVEWVV